MKTILLPSVMVFLCISSTTFAQGPTTEAAADLKHQRKVDMYQQQTITTITNRKDQLLQEYGSFEAAREAGAIVRPEPTEVASKFVFGVATGVGTKPEEEIR